MKESGKLSAFRRAGAKGTERGKPMNQNVLYRNVIQLIAFVAVIQDISVPASVFGEIPELLDSFQKIFCKGGS